MNTTGILALQAVLRTDKACLYHILTALQRRAQPFRTMTKQALLKLTDLLKSIFDMAMQPGNVILLNINYCAVDKLVKAS